MDQEYPKTQFFFLRKKTQKTQKKKTKNVNKYAKICDMPFEQRSLIHWEACFPGGPRILKNPNFFEKRRKLSKTEKTQKNLEI